MSSGHLVAKGVASQNTCIGVATALTVLSILIVLLRVYTRVFVVHNVGKDDCAILFALLLTIAYLITIFVMKDNRLGFSGKLLKPHEMVNQVQTTLAIQIIYYFLVNAIKISILFFYLRIATRRLLDLLIKGTIGFLTMFCTICVICCLTQCIPLYKMWDLNDTIAGRCINTTAFFYTTSSINIAADLWILALPISTLLKVQRPKREKAALVGIFSLGIISCIASIVRLHAIRIYTESPDPFFDSVPINVWSMVEVNVGIYCASIPALKALCLTAQRQRSTTSGYHYHDRERSGKSSDQDNSGNGDTVIRTDSYGMKALESDAQLAKAGGDARPQNWLASDSELSQEHIIHPEQRV